MDDFVGQGRERRDQQRVAVTAGAGDKSGGDAGSGAGLVLDHHLLPHHGPGALGVEAGDDVGRGSRREADDQMNWARRVIRRKSGRRATALSPDQGVIETCDRCESSAPTFCFSSFAVKHQLRPSVPQACF